MSKSTHTLNMKKGSTTYACDLYTTTAEAKVYNPAYLPLKVDDTTLYAALYPATGYSQVYYDDFGTPLHVKKGDNEYVLATKSLIRLGITAVANETITVTAGGVSWTSGNKYFPYGTAWSAAISGAEGWAAGSLTPGSSGTLINANVNVTAGAATYKTFTLKLNGGWTQQTVTLKYKNKKSDGTFDAEVTKTSTSSAQSFTVGYGTTWTASVAANTGWTAGTLSPGTSGTVTAATTVTATSATFRTFTLKLAKQTNQTITLKYKNKKSDGTFESEVTKTSSSSDQSFTVGYGTTWTATITASTGYNAGALSPGASGTVTAATTVTAGAASIKTFTVTVTLPSNGTIKVNNVAATSSKKTFTFNYNTSVTIQVTANTGYQVDKLEVT